jgi:hypothetical protein
MKSKDRMKQMNDWGGEKETRKEKNQLKERN